MSMKRAFVLGISLLFGIITLWAQVPQHFSYQAVIRNNDGSATASQKVSVRVSILQGSESGTVMYTETHSVKSNPNGLITLQIGDGFPVNGSFSAIDWQHGPFFLKTEVDPNGGNNLSLVSVQQLLSVPYALYAEKAGSVKDAVDKGYVDNQDNRLKDYVDSLWALSPSVDTSRIGAPVVVTDSAVVYRHYAKVSGKVLSDGGELIMSRGFCYGTRPNPTISDNYVLLGNGKGEFSGAITGLQDSVTYYVRAFATSRYGTAYGAQRSISTNSKNNRTFGIFAVSDSTYVRFAPGNLNNNTNSLHFAKNQYDTGAEYRQTLERSSFYVDGENWRVLSYDEANYLISNHMTIAAEINGIMGVIVFPYNWYTQEIVDSWVFISAIGWKKSYESSIAANGFAIEFISLTREQWSELEAKGAVFFPVTNRFGQGYYLLGDKSLIQLNVNRSTGSGVLYTSYGKNTQGFVRLVQDVKK
jgi:hypothetical protein